jgi:hypothetical protein
MPPVAERLRREYPALLERAGVGSIPANFNAQNVSSFCRWRFEMKLSPFFDNVIVILLHIFYDPKNFKASKNLGALITTLFFDYFTSLEC